MRLNPAGNLLALTLASVLAYTALHFCLGCGPSLEPEPTPDPQPDAADAGCPLHTATHLACQE